MRAFFLSILFLCINSCGDESSTNRTTSVTTNNLSGEEQYQLTIQANWTSSRFPAQFPANPHFSPIAGMTYNSSISLFKTGSKATNGVIQVAETGGTTIINSEITNSIVNGGSNLRITGTGIGNGTGSATINFPINSSHSYISLVSMIAPSPDWFIGIDSVNLVQGGAWVDQKIIDLRVYDAGSDAGTTFTAVNAGQNPRLNITRLNSGIVQFSDGVAAGTNNFIARLTFKRVK